MRAPIDDLIFNCIELFLTYLYYTQPLSELIEAFRKAYYLFISTISVSRVVHSTHVCKLLFLPPSPFSCHLATPGRSPTDCWRFTHVRVIQPGLVAVQMTTTSDDNHTWTRDVTSDGDGEKRIKMTESHWKLCISPKSVPAPTTTTSSPTLPGKASWNLIRINIKPNSIQQKQESPHPHH